VKALSLWQPHAQAIGLELKRYETRDWAMSYRGPLAIHAAKRRWDDEGTWHARARSILLGLGWYVSNLPYGAVVCIADVVDCIPTARLRGNIPSKHEFWGDFSDGDSGRGRYAFELANVRMLPSPIRCRGQQGLFEVDLGAQEVSRPSAETLSLFEGM
jgi:hypothetical protein